MQNIIKQQPKEIQIILGAICRKWQADFAQRATGKQEKRTKKDYELKNTLDYILIEKLVEEIQKLNNGKLFTDYWIEDF